MNREAIFSLGLKITGPLYIIRSDLSALRRFVSTNVRPILLVALVLVRFCITNPFFSVTVVVSSANDTSVFLQDQSKKKWVLM